MARDKVDDEELMSTVRRTSTNTLDTISRRIQAAHQAKIENTKIFVESPGKVRGSASISGTSSRSSANEKSKVGK